MDAYTTSVLNTAIGALPAIIGLIKAQHAQAQPDAPALTDDEVIAALHSAVLQSVAKADADDAAIRAKQGEQFLP